jgi:hypothetical protein
MIHIQRYTNGKGQNRLLLAARQEDLLEIGVDEETIGVVNPNTGLVRARFDEPDIGRWEGKAIRHNVAVTKAEQKRLHQMTMKTFVDDDNALMFYTAVSRTEIGRKITHSTPGVRSLPVRWPDLAGIMMRDGWIEVGTQRLTDVGLEEAKQCRQLIENRMRER